MGADAPLAAQDGGKAAPQAATVGERVAACSVQFQLYLEAFFEHVGVICVRRPLVVFSCAILMCFVCALGASTATMDGDPYSMFTVYQGQWELGNAYTLAHQGGEPGVQPTFEYIMLEPSGGDAVDRSVLEDELRLMRAVSELTVRDSRGEERTLSDVCQAVDVASAVPDLAPLMRQNLTGAGGLLTQLVSGQGGHTLGEELRGLAEDGTLERLADAALDASPLNVSSVRELEREVVAANLSALGNENLTQPEAVALNKRIRALLLRLGVVHADGGRGRLPGNTSGYDPETGAYVVRVSDDQLERVIGLNGTEMNKLLLQIRADNPAAPGAAPRLGLPEVTPDQARRMRESAVGAALSGDPYAQAATVGALAALWDLADDAGRAQAELEGRQKPAAFVRPEGIPARYDPGTVHRFVQANGTLNPDFVRHVVRKLRLEPPEELRTPRARPSARSWPGTSAGDWDIRPRSEGQGASRDSAPRASWGAPPANASAAGPWQGFMWTRDDWERLVNGSAFGAHPPATARRGYGDTPGVPGADSEVASGSNAQAPVSAAHTGAAAVLQSWLDGIAHAVYGEPDVGDGGADDGADAGSGWTVPSDAPGRTAGGGAAAGSRAQGGWLAPDSFTAAPDPGGVRIPGPGLTSGGQQQTSAPSPGPNRPATVRPFLADLFGGPRPGQVLEGTSHSADGSAEGVRAGDVLTAGLWEAWLSLLDVYNLTAPDAWAKHDAEAARHRRAAGFDDVPAVEAEGGEGYEVGKATAEGADAKRGRDGMDGATAYAQSLRGAPAPREFETIVDLAFAHALLQLNRTRAALGLPLPELDETLAQVPLPAGLRRGTVESHRGGPATSPLPGEPQHTAAPRGPPVRALAPAERVERLGGLAQLLGALAISREAAALGLADVDVIGAIAPPRVQALLGNQTAPGRAAVRGAQSAGVSGGTARADQPLTGTRLVHAYYAARKRYDTQRAGAGGEGGEAVDAGADGAAADEAADRAAAEAEAEEFAREARSALQGALRSPCIRTTVLDCFAEGGYDFPISADQWRMMRLVPAVREALDKAGVDAYTMRPSFRDPDLDVGAQLTGGCAGFAGRVPALVWREEAMLGGLRHDATTGAVAHAAALRSTVLLAGDRTVARRLNVSEEEAADLTNRFRLALEGLVPTVPLHSSRASIFVSDAFLRVVDEHMGSASEAVGAGYLLMVLYVVAVLGTPWLALASILLLVCDLAGGFGLACLAGVPSSILTLTVLPFVALGIAVDGLFLILRTFEHASADAEAQGRGARTADLIPRVTRAVGPSILFTGCTNGAAYAAASTIPLHAIMNFSRQCGMLLFFNAAITLVGVPALIALLFKDKAGVGREGDGARGPRGKLEADAGDEAGGEEGVGDAASTGGAWDAAVWDASAFGSRSGASACSGGAGGARGKEGGSKWVPTRGAGATRASQAVDGSGPTLAYGGLGAGVRVGEGGRSDSDSSGDAATLAQSSDRGTPSSRVGRQRATAVASPGGSSAATGAHREVVAAARTPTCMERASVRLAAFVVSPFGHWFLVAAFASLTVASVVGITYMEPGLILSELVPSTDITSAYLTAEGNHFSFFPVTVATKRVDYEKPEVQQALVDLHSRVTALREVVQPAPPFWLHQLLAHANATGALDRDGFLPPRLFYPVFNDWRAADPLSFAESQGNFGFDDRGRIVYAEIPLFVHGVQDPAPCITFVGELAALCDEATGEGLPSYALGLPFYRCERYVHLRFWCVRGVAVALAVVFAVAVLFMGALREAALMTATLLLNLVQLAGCLAFAGMKINGALVMATVASIGCASEYAGHFTIAFLQARGGRAERISFAYGRSLHPLFDSACSTVLGIAMIAFAAFPFVVKYFFVPMVVLTILNFCNAVLLLPALLLLLGAPAPAAAHEHALDDDPVSVTVAAHAEERSPAPKPKAAAEPPGRTASNGPTSPATPEPLAAQRGGATLWWDQQEGAGQSHSQHNVHLSPSPGRTILFSGFDLKDEASPGEDSQCDQSTSRRSSRRSSREHMGRMTML